MLQKRKFLALVSLSCFVFINFLGAMGDGFEEESFGIDSLFEEPTSPSLPIACSGGSMMNPRCPKSVRTLYDAILDRKLDLIEELARNLGTEMDSIVDFRGNSILHLTLNSHRINESQDVIEQIVAILLKNKSIYLIATNGIDNTPLHLAITNGLLGCALLIARAINESPFLPNIQNTQGETTLHLAVAQNAFDVVAEILQHKKIAVNLLNNQNQTALDIAVENGFSDLATLLREHNAERAYDIIPGLSHHQRKPSSLDGEIFPFEADETVAAAPAAPASAPSALQHTLPLFPDMESGYGILGT